jgi:FliI/YscN family ATPase
MSMLAPYFTALDSAAPFQVQGQVDSVRGLTVRAVDLPLPVDSAVEIVTADGARLPGQVIGFEQHLAMIMPLGSLKGIGRGNIVRGRQSAQRVACSPLLIGRVIDALGRPMDGLGPVRLPELRPVNVRAVDCMRRVPIDKPIGTGLRSVDALLTCGLGQRMGIFSGPGVGKSTLMSMIAKHTSADISVIALIGERGREVQDFLQQALGPEGLARSVVIVSTADDSPLLRVRAARVASTVAEYFRDQGKDVLLLLDSLTRMAQAQRQIGLSVGEPPATKGFTPSVFALLPEILERAGRTDVGSITGFYTVLVESDDFNEPIADAVKGITDGHLWLDRKLANRGHFPAIGILESISRVRPEVTNPEQQGHVRRVQELLARYADLEDLVNIGAYAFGADPINDLAVRVYPRIMEFLKQSTKAPTTFAQAKVQLIDLIGVIDKEAKVIEGQRRGNAAAAAPAANRPAARKG